MPKPKSDSIELIEKYIYAAKAAGYLTADGGLSASGRELGIVLAEEDARNVRFSSEFDPAKLKQKITFYATTTVFEKELGALKALNDLRRHGQASKEIPKLVKRLLTGSRDESDLAHKKLYLMAAEGNKHVVIALSKAIEKGNDKKGEAAALLGDIGDERGVYALVQKLYNGREENLICLKACAASLGKLDYADNDLLDQAIAALEGSGGLGSEYDRVKLASAEALARIGKKPTVKVLEAALSKEPPAVLRESLEQAIKEIKKREKKR